MYRSAASNLRLTVVGAQVMYKATAAGANRRGVVTWAEFECPSLVGTPTVPGYGGTPSVLPFAPEASGPIIKVGRQWLTDIQPSRAATEVRVNLRDTAQRLLEYTVARAEPADLASFWLQWLTSVTPLRFKVPLWSDRASLTATVASGATTLSVLTTDYDFAANQDAIIWQNENSYEIVRIATVATSSLVLSTAVTGTWALTAKVYPVLTCWVDPPTAPRTTPILEEFEIVAREELPGIAGVDTAVGTETTATVSAVSLYAIDADSLFTYSPNEITVRALVVDANGISLDNASVTWSVSSGSQTGDSILATSWTHLARFTVASSPLGRIIQAVAGGVTSTLSFSFGTQ